MRFDFLVKDYQTIYLKKSSFNFYGYRSLTDLHIRLVLCKNGTILSQALLDDRQYFV
jgi:hypothetical protein